MRRLFTTALMVASVLCLPLGCRQRPRKMRTVVLLEEPFREPPSLTDRWEIRDARDAILGPSIWFVRDSAIWQTSNIFRRSPFERVLFQGSNLLTRRGQEWTDCQITVKFKANDDDGVGVLFRYQDEDHHYRFITVDDKANGGPFRRLQIIDGPRIATLAESRRGYTRGERHTIRVRLAGDDIRAWFDGEELATRNSRYRNGRAGLLTYAENPISFYFVRITKEVVDPDS